jgi:hypothetical protein
MPLDPLIFRGIRDPATPVVRYGHRLTLGLSDELRVDAGQAAVRTHRVSEF